MKKLFFVTTLALTLAFSFTSCKDEKKNTDATTTEVTTETENVEATTEAKEIAAVVYQCPMDCEHGKTYDKPGNCPVCKMEIKEVKTKVATEAKEVDEHAGHNHD